MTGPTLLDLVEQPPAVTRVRVGDPETSHRAAASMTPVALRKQQTLVLWGLCQLYRCGDTDATVHDLALRLAYTGRSPAENVLVKRCRELEELGLVRETESRRPGGSGRLQIVWALTDDGREVGESLSSHRGSR